MGAPDLLPALAAYAAMLRDSPHNLLSPRGLQELEERHFPEGLRFAASLPEASRLLDVGSGGGLPGVVVALARPDLEVHLLEATAKKAAFLKHVGEQLGLDLVVHAGRAEELASGDLRATFDLVTARAVAPLERLVAWTAPFCRVGGQVHAIKGERWADEVEQARAALKAHGMEVRATPNDGPGSSAGATGDGPLVVILERVR